MPKFLDCKEKMKKKSKKKKVKKICVDAKQKTTFFACM